MKYKTQVRAVRSVREAQSIKRRENRFNDAVSLVKSLLSFGCGQLVAFSQGHEMNRSFVQDSFEVGTDITFVGSDNSV